MRESSIHFEAVIVRLGGWSTGVVVPPEVLERLPLEEQPRLRVEGEVNGHPYEGALHHAGGERFVMLPKRWLRASGVREGQFVEVEIRPADPNRVDVPEELDRAIREAGLTEAWAELTPGTRRSMAYHVTSAKRSETRERRSETVLGWVRDPDAFRVARGGRRRTGNPEDPGWG